jgi:hypothetical protein
MDDGSAGLERIAGFEFWRSWWKYENVMGGGSLSFKLTRANRSSGVSRDVVCVSLGTVVGGRVRGVEWYT